MAGAIAGTERTHVRGGTSPYEDRFSQETVALGLRSHAARGTIINAAFQIGLAVLVLIRRLVVAGFLTAAEFGVWGVLLTTILTVMFIKNVGIADRFVQQAEDDQEREFQKAFTIDLVLGLAATALAAIALPLFALAYGRSEIIVPGLILSLAIIGNSLQSPTWIYYRRMDFVRQRTLLAVDPCVAFAVTVALAIAGAGYWCLIIGAVVGSFAGAAVALAACPYKIALRLGRGTVRDYFGFSWPLAVANGTNLAVIQGALLIATRTVGLFGAGAIGLAGSITAFTDGVDGIVTQTVYPAVCAVRDRRDLLFEAFVKSNRLALMWGMPFGVGVALFAPDLVHFVLGTRWDEAIVVIQAFGIVAALDQLGFNWTAFFRAVNYTKPMAVVSALNLLSFAVFTAPLLLAFGLKGLAAGWLLAQGVTLAGRTYYLTRLFEGFGVLRHAGRAMAPVIPGLALVLISRVALAGIHRTVGLAVAELLVFAVVTLAATACLERTLLREVLEYLVPRSRSIAPTPVAVNQEP
jgi:O-antigen/teichoic acid export membrane protein